MLTDKLKAFDSAKNLSDSGKVSAIKEMKVDSSGIKQKEDTIQRSINSISKSLSGDDAAREE